MNVKQGIYQNDVCKLSFTEVQTSSKMNLQIRLHRSSNLIEDEFALFFICKKKFGIIYSL